MKRIIYDNGSGGVGHIQPEQSYLDSLSGTEEEKVIYVANKDLPTGTKYEIVDESDIPTDRRSRANWTYVSGPNERISEDL